MTQVLKWMFVAAAMGTLASAQTLSPVEGGLSAGEKRHVHVVTLTRWGFEPQVIKTQPGKVTVLVRDLSGGTSAPIELRQGGKSGAVLQTRARAARWRLVEEIQLVLAPGQYHFGIADSRSRSLTITVGEK